MRLRPFLGDAEVLDAQVKKWRFAGPKVEGAFNSGVAAAAVLADLV